MNNKTKKHFTRARPKQVREDNPMAEITGEKEGFVYVC